MRRRLTSRKSPILALGTIAASGLLLSGCGEDIAEGDVLFTSVDKCVTSGVDLQLCRVAYQDSMSAHLSSAPRFTSKASCEAGYGPGQCLEQAASTVPGNAGNTGTFFVPFLAGFVLSSSINTVNDYYSSRRRQEEEANSGGGGGGGYYGSSPVYRDRSGGFVVPAKQKSGGSVEGSHQAFKPVNVNTRTVARQGFGGRSMFSFGG